MQNSLNPSTYIRTFFFSGFFIGPSLTSSRQLGRVGLPRLYVPHGLPPLGTCFQNACPFPPVWRSGSSAGVSPHLRTWSLGSPISVPGSKFGLPVAPSKVTLLSTRDLPNGFSVIPVPWFYCAEASISRWCDQGYRLDPTDR